MCIRDRCRISRPSGSYRSYLPKNGEMRVVYCSAYCCSFFFSNSFTRRRSALPLSLIHIYLRICRIIVLSAACFYNPSFFLLVIFPCIIGIVLCQNGWGPAGLDTQRVHPRMEFQPGFVAGFHHICLLYTSGCFRFSYNNVRIPADPGTDGVLP